MRKQQIQTYNDGLLTVYRTINAAPPGETPVERLEKKYVLRYEERTIGVHRAYLAMQAEDRLDLLLRVPYRKDVAAQDVVIPTLDGHQYRIKMVQKPKDITPPSMDLSLERLTEDYDLEAMP